MEDCVTGSLIGYKVLDPVANHQHPLYTQVMLLFGGDLFNSEIIYKMRTRVVLFWNFAVYLSIKKMIFLNFFNLFSCITQLQPSGAAPSLPFQDFCFSFFCLFSVKLICARTAKAVWTGLCPRSTMVPTHLFVVHKSWLFRACQNVALAPVPTHLLDNESSGNYRHKMTARVSEVVFNWEETGWAYLQRLMVYGVKL